MEPSKRFGGHRIRSCSNSCKGARSGRSRYNRMNRQALVGIFTVVALLGLFGFFLVLANVGTQGRYKIGVHFKSAPGLHKGALVYESGVVVGVVDQTQLLPEDFTVDVILAINNNVDVPRNARFLIQAPLTGESTVGIVPRVPVSQPSGMAAPTNAPNAVAVLPRQVLPLDQQPQGTNPATIQDLLDQGQGEVRRLDRRLARRVGARPEPHRRPRHGARLGSAAALEHPADDARDRADGEHLRFDRARPAGSDRELADAGAAARYRRERRRRGAKG